MSERTTSNEEGGVAKVTMHGPDSITPFTGAAPAPGTTETFGKKLERGLENLADVTVATVISNVTVTFDQRGRLNSVTAPKAKVSAIISNINIVDGNVTTIIGEDLQDNAALGTFHQGIVDKAVKVLPDNIKTLIEVIQGFFPGKK